MKKNLFVLMSLLLMTLSTGCSKDDDETEDQLTVNFQLQREDGRECYDFREGENIVFSLEVKNNTDDDIQILPFAELMGFDVFHVYSENGEDMGKPWDKMFDYLVPFNVIEANSSFVKVCPWFSIPSLARNDLFSDCFYKEYDKSPLPKGEYYSKFDVKLGDETVTCSRSFTIR